MGAHDVLPVVKDIPVICSCFGQDVTREIGTHLNRVMTENFSGINNFPTMGMVDGQFREQLELTNLGFQKEVDMVRIAREKDIFTIVYVFNEKESRACLLYTSQGHGDAGREAYSDRGHSKHGYDPGY